MGYIVLVERRVVENFRKCSDAIRDTGKHLDHSQVVKTLKEQRCSVCNLYIPLNARNSTGWAEDAAHGRRWPKCNAFWQVT